MGFHAVRFPDSIARGATGGPEYLTTVAATAGGRERRQQNWSAPKLRWNVGTGLRRRADVAALIAFFRARRGKAYAFLFKDWSDYEAPRAALGATDGSAAEFQLVKVYGDGVEAVSRTITRPVAGTVRCWVDGVEIARGPGAGEFQVDDATGRITLGATHAATTGLLVEGACEFNVRVRFDTDHLALTLQSFDIGEWADIPVVEDLE